MVAIEPGGDFLIKGGVREEVACELFDGELIEGLILVEGFDDPVAPTPHAAESVVLVSVGISEACGFEPREGHGFSVSWGGEKSVDEVFVGVGVGVVDEVLYFLESGRESGEVESEAADEGFFRGFGRRLEMLFVEFEGDEVVNRVIWPGWGGYVFGRDGFGGWDEGPVTFPMSSFFDPLGEKRFLFFGESRSRPWRGHDFFGVCGVGAGDDFAFFWVKGNNCGELWVLGVFF